VSEEAYALQTLSRSKLGTAASEDGSNGAAAANGTTNGTTNGAAKGGMKRKASWKNLKAAAASGSHVSLADLEAQYQAGAQKRAGNESALPFKPLAMTFRDVRWVWGWVGLGWVGSGRVGSGRSSLHGCMYVAGDWWGGSL